MKIAPGTGMVCLALGARAWVWLNETIYVYVCINNTRLGILISAHFSLLGD